MLKQFQFFSELQDYLNDTAITKTCIWLEPDQITVRLIKTESGEDNLFLAVRKDMEKWLTEQMPGRYRVCLLGHDSKCLEFDREEDAVNFKLNFA